MVNKSLIMLIAKKDIRALSKSRKTWLPMLISSVLICIVMPLCVALLTAYGDVTMLNEDVDVKRMVTAVVEKMPEGDAKEAFLIYEHVGEQFTFFFINYMLVSMFMMITVINSMITATSSFVSEKERGTLETLLFSPISVQGLFIGKALASFLPTILLTYGAYLITFIGTNILLYPKFGTLFMFNQMWLILLIWVMPMILIFTILINILISSKTKTFQEAQQMGGLLVLPVVGILVSQASGLIFVNEKVLMLAGGVMMITNLLMLTIIVKKASRNELFEKQIH